MESRMGHPLGMAQAREKVNPGVRNEESITKIFLTCFQMIVDIKSFLSFSDDTITSNNVDRDASLSFRFSRFFFMRRK